MENKRSAIVPPSTEVERRRDSSAELSLLATRLISVLSHLDTAVVTFDSSGACRFCSPLLSEMLHVTPKSLDDFLSVITHSPGVRERILSMLESSRRGIDEPPLDVHLPGYNGEDRFNLLEVIAFGDSDKADFAVIIRDATAEMGRRKDIQRLTQLASLGQIAAGAAHEFNNILTSMLGWTQVARQNTEAESSAGQALEIIEENAQKAKRIFTKLLNLSRSDQDEETLDLVSPQKVVEDVLMLLSWEMKSAKIEVVSSFHEVGLCHVDEDRVAQVLINIVRNAIDAMGKKGGTLEVSVANTGEMAEITFRDSGPGMEPGVLSHVFDSFFTTKRRDDERVSGGTGLGLSISLDILKMHGGDIKVESEPGRGTCFTVLLPLAYEQTPADHEEDERDSKPTIPPDAVVLVVDDEPDVGEMVRTSLELKGITVLAVGSGEEAVNKCGEMSFDAAFVDFSMPGLSGNELGRRLLDIRPDLPIVFMSGVDVETDITEDFLKKPFDIDDIQLKLHEVLKRRKSG